MSGNLIGVAFFQPFVDREFCYQMVPFVLQKSYDVVYLFRLKLLNSWHYLVECDGIDYDFTFLPITYNAGEFRNIFFKVMRITDWGIEL